MHDFSRFFLAFILASTTLSAGVEQTPPQASFLATRQIDLVRLLPPPPEDGSPEQRADEGLVLERQRSRTKEQSARSAADGELSVLRFADVLGSAMANEKLPKTTTLFGEILASMKAPLREVKEHWRRPRPYVANKKIHPAAGIVESMRSLDPNAAIHSYPNGHAMFGEICAILLSEMVPEKANALFKRGREYGENRIIGGVHFMSDTEAGRTAGAVFVFAIESNPQFQLDFAAAKSELRNVLGLGK